MTKSVINSCSFIGLSSMYIDRMAKVLRTLKVAGRSKTNPITMQHGDQFSPAVFSFNSDDGKLFRSASLIIMPVRLDG